MCCDVSGFCNFSEDGASHGRHVKVEEGAAYTGLRSVKGCLILSFTDCRRGTSSIITSTVLKILGGFLMKTIAEYTPKTLVEI